MTTRVLVTGATGFLGNNVVRVLRRRRYAVRVLVREGYDPSCLEGLEVEPHLGDIRDARSIHAALRSVAAVVHCAAVVQIGWSSKAGHQQVNVDGTRNILEAAADRDLRLIHISSVNALAFDVRPENAVTSDEATPLTGREIACNYVVSKRKADALVMDRIQRTRPRFRATIIHPGFMLGPWDWKPSSGQMLREVASGRPFLAPRGGCSVCDVRDVANGIVTCLETEPPSHRYILAGHSVSYFELWCAIASIAGSRPPVGTFGPIVSRVAGAIGDLAAAVRGREGVINSASIQMASCLHYYSSDRAACELGYKFRPWLQTVQDAWDWFRHRHGDRLEMEKYVGNA